MVATQWVAVSPGPFPILTWQKRIRHMRRYLRGWAKNISGRYKKEKQRLLGIIDTLDLKAEVCALSSNERE